MEHFLGHRYYKLNRFYLLSLGLWPYSNSVFKQIQASFWSALLMSSIIVQLLRLFTMEYNLELVLADLSLAIPAIIYVVKYSTFYIQPLKIKELIEHIQNGWNMLKDGQEIGIIKKYAKSGKKYIYSFAAIIYPGSIGFALMPLVPDILDILVPLNESRTRYLPYVTEHFLDQQKYFYFILWHMNFAVIVGIIIILSTETLFFACVYYTCGMFELVSYRIKQALNENMSIRSTLDKKNAFHMKVISSVEIHQRTIKFIEDIESTFGLSYLILIAFGVTSLSINLFRLFQTATLADQRKNFVLFLIFVVAHFYYMFICNYMGQKITDNSMEICKKIYDTQWYTESVQTQKLLLFVMQRSMKSCKFIVGGIYPVSLENFTTLASMSLSYFTVIYAVHQ